MLSARTRANKTMVFLREHDHVAQRSAQTMTQTTTQTGRVADGAPGAAVSRVSWTLLRSQWHQRTQHDRSSAEHMDVFAQPRRQDRLRAENMTAHAQNTWMVIVLLSVSWSY